MKSKLAFQSILQDLARTIYLSGTAFWTLGLTLSVFIYCVTFQLSGPLTTIFLCVEACFIPLSVLMAAYYEGRLKWQVMLVVIGHFCILGFPFLLYLPFFVLPQVVQIEHFNQFINSNGPALLAMAIALPLSYLTSMGAFACWILFRARTQS